jgi:hypothetical protein
VAQAIAAVVGLSTAGSGQASGASAAGGGAFGTLAQAASVHASTARPMQAARTRGEREMLWFALEIVLGLALFIGIVWWTLPRAPRDRPKHPPED